MKMILTVLSFGAYQRFLVSLLYFIVIAQRTMDGRAISMRINLISLMSFVNMVFWQTVFRQNEQRASAERGSAMHGLSWKLSTAKRPHCWRCLLCFCVYLLCPIGWWLVGQVWRPDCRTHYIHSAYPVIRGQTVVDFVQRLLKKCTIVRDCQVTSYTNA